MPSNPYTSRAIKQAKVLRQLIIRMNEHDRIEQAEEDEEEEQIRAKKDSTDYPAKQLEKFNEDADEVADWEPDTENEEILFLVDRILYKLMSYEDDTWTNQDDYEERTQLKLQEILKKPSMRVYKRGFSYYK
jgi:hypothetical protein